MSNTFKTSKNLVLMAALLALLSSPAPGMAAGPAAVDLGSAGNFAILSTSGITDVSASAIVGDIGTSPITGAAIHVPCTEVVGTIYSVDAAGPVCEVINPTLLGLAVGDMMLAYADAASRAPTHPTELGAGNISGLTLAPGVWTWSSSVVINSDVTLKGGPNDVWILQIAGNLDIASGGDIASGIKVILVGGARAANVFWQVAGITTLGTYSTFNGTILDETLIALQTGAVLNGRAQAQTAVTLQQNAITAPEETKTQCQGFLKSEKTVFDNGQKAEKTVFDNGQKAAKLAFQLTHPTSAQLKAFTVAQAAAKQLFADGQKADKLDFAAQQIIDKAQCNTLL
jgi:hypothetical protein